MKIQFDGNQEYQLDAIKAVVDVFDGQPLSKGDFEFDLSGTTGEFLSELGVANQLLIDEGKILENVRRIQKRNNLPVTDELKGMNFSVEMETGTGKTYVYLRTIHELHKRYGFSKFIIVVPSVAIREGVKKNLDITAEHFKTIYDNPPFDYWIYDSNRVSKLRQFANSRELQILIINIDAFNKDSNIINKENDRLSGRKPIEFIQATNPIVIIDEPQNMESAQSKEAIASLNPLCTLRYSATHRDPYNLLYRLDPVKAYEMRLVKRIEVDAVLDDQEYVPFVQVDSIQATKTRITAKLTIDVQESDGVKRKKVTVKKPGEDLYDLSKGRTPYRGFIVDEINAGDQYITFTNGIRLSVGESIGTRKDDIMRVQIEETVKEHLDKELQIYNKLPEGKRLKVLSLFFIDRVANYAEEDGKIRRWFIEAYNKYASRPKYRPLNLPPVEEVHSGYFAKDQKGEAKDTRGESKADEEAYELIMRDKERLLSLDEPTRFIFSHSALREGWDNPNVFQICTLNETRSTIRKRQEIGRGLRLPVDQTGNRVFDPNINRLTVIANESYDNFARQLQKEIEDETGRVFPKENIGNTRRRKKANLVDKWRENTEFLELWERIKHKTRYSVEFDSNDLIRQAAEAINQMPPIEPPRIRTEKTGLDISEKGLSGTLLAINRANVEYQVKSIPDLLSYIQKETELTRKTIADILIKSGRLKDVMVNPQKFLDQVTKEIKRTLNSVIVNGIKYEKIDGQYYEMTKFESEEINGYIDRMINVKKSIYDAVEFDSEVEKQFAEALDAREDIKFFLKLPRWFTVDTPVGKYNPDWAIVKQEGDEDLKLYLVAETKSTHDEEKRRQSENEKIKCGRAHFEALGNVEFVVATDVREV